MAYKQVILVRKDLDLPKGKLAAQAAHASVEATLKSAAIGPDEEEKIDLITSKLPLL